ncbi:MAG: four helix bundle protein [Spirochaetota bacterium]|nr:four helix bundle protein [Spirochaetota bacterium]
MAKEIKKINALTKVYYLLLWIIPVLECFPRSQRFLLGNRIEESLLDIIDLIIQTVYTSEKKEFLAVCSWSNKLLNTLPRGG